MATSGGTVRQLIWSAQARANLIAIQRYIGLFSPLNAERFSHRLVEAVETLAELPERGRVGRGGQRDFTAIWPYVVRYRVTATTIYIIRVKHGARRPD